MRSRILIWALVLLILMNISAVVTMLYHKNRENKVEENSGYTTSQSEESMQYSGRWFRDELQLTRDQMREFSRFNPVFRQRMRYINIELGKKRQEMLDELTAEKSDTVRLNELSDSIGALHSGLKKATYEYYLEFKKVCNPGQLQKLHSIFDRIFEGEIPAAGPGKGMQGGRRFGMRWKATSNH